MNHYLATILLFLSALTMTPSSAFGQDKDSSPKKEQHDSEHAAHMASVLGLDASTSERFSQLYRQFLAEMREARRQHPRIKGDKDHLTDAEVRTNIERQFDLAQATLDVRRKYYQEWVKILTPRQIERLYNLEKKSAEHIRKMAQEKTKKTKKK